MLGSNERVIKKMKCQKKEEKRVVSCVDHSVWIKCLACLKKKIYIYLEGEQNLYGVFV